MCLNSGEMTTDNFFKNFLEGENDKGGKMTKGEKWQRVLQ